MIIAGIRKKDAFLNCSFCITSTVSDALLTDDSIPKRAKIKGNILFPEN